MKPEPKTKPVNFARAERLLRMHSGLKIKLKPTTAANTVVTVEGFPEVEMTVEVSKLRREDSIIAVARKLKPLFSHLVKSKPKPKHKKTYTHDFDIMFSVCESPHANPEDITAEELLAALRRRASLVTVEEIQDASCHVQTIEDTSLPSSN